MKCMYCYEEDKTSTYTWEEIKVVLDNIVKHNKHFVLEFLGGEPCLEMGLMCQTVEYLSNLEGVDVEKYIITTNGTIINDDLINLLKNNEDILWSVSLDGTRLMNFMRIMNNNKNSFDTVMANAQILRKELGENNHQMGVHIVSHLYNVGYLAEGIEVLYKRGFKFIDVGIVESTMEIDYKFCKSFVEQLKITSDQLKAGKLPGLMVGILEWLKPVEDERHYIRDETGKVVLETYGRVEDDIKDSEEYKTPPSWSPVSDKINRLREEVYNYHKGL